MLLELAQALKSDGWDVTVLTGFPNHPSGIVFDGYKKRWFQEELIEGVRVWRVFLFTSPRRSPFTRFLNFLSFTFTSAWTLLFRAQPGLIFAVFQPLSIGLTLPLIARLKRAKLVLNIQDLHPDAAVELGLVKNPLVIRLLRRLERHGYRSADALVVISEGFRQHCTDRGASRMAVVGNWIDLDAVKPENRENPMRRELGLKSHDFVVLYAGTTGMVSGAGVLIDAAEHLASDPKVKIVFVGDGSLNDALRAQVDGRGLSNVHFAPFQQRDRLSEVQAMADVSVVTLSRGRGRTSIPSKVMGYMAAARPVVASVDEDCETARLIWAAECGRVVAAGDGGALAAAIRQIQRDAELRARLGANGRRYLEEHLTRSVVTRKYVDFFREITAVDSAS